MSNNSSRKNRWIAMIAITILMAASFVGWKYWQSFHSNKIIILVADLEGPYARDHQVTETLIKQLREATRQYNSLQIKALAKPITAQEGSNVARTTGIEREADIVLW
ncbi:MAG: hypothetical protein ACREOB_06455, partial [Thermodesulfobacteriota bacterium]